MLSGYKTYITAALTIAVQVGVAMGYVPQPVADILTPALLGGGLAFLRAGVGNKVERKKKGV